MPIDPANASELATIACEVGAEVVEGDLRYPSETGSWQLGEVDLGEHMDRYRDGRSRNRDGDVSGWDSFLTTLQIWTKMVPY
jgi:hypothetical protein